MVARERDLAVSIANASATNGLRPRAQRVRIHGSNDRVPRFTLARVPRFTRPFSLVLATYALWAPCTLLVHTSSTVAPSGMMHLVLCPMKRLAGIPCPICGGTRAAVALANFHAADAWRLNPMVTVAIPLVVFLLTLRVVFGRVVSVRLSPTARRVAWAGFVITLALNWAWVIWVGN